MKNRTLFFLTSLLFSLTLCLLPFTCLYAQGTITWIESFADNSNKWAENHDRLPGREDTLYVKRKVQQGKYLIEASDKMASHDVYVHPGLPIDKADFFQIEGAVQFIGVREHQQYGLVWGASKDHLGRYHFTISPTGEWEYGRFDDKGGVTVTDKVPPNVYRPQSANKFTVRKAGDTLEFYVNNVLIHKEKYQAPFSDAVGFRVGGKMTLEAHNISVTVSSSQVPTGWHVVNEGNLKSRFIWDNIKDYSGMCRAEVYNGSRLALKKQFEGEYVMVAPFIAAPPDVPGSSCGAFLKSEDNAFLSMERAYTPQRIAAVFSTSTGGKELGSKKEMVGNGDIGLKIYRQGDTFTGGANSVKVGSLKWPNLSKKQEIGVFLNYNNPEQNAPAFVKYPDIKLSIGELRNKDFQF